MIRFTLAGRRGVAVARGTRTLAQKARPGDQNAVPQGFKPGASGSSGGVPVNASPFPWSRVAAVGAAILAAGVGVDLYRRYRRDEEIASLAGASSSSKARVTRVAARKSGEAEDIDWGGVPSPTAAETRVCGLVQPSKDGRVPSRGIRSFSRVEGSPRAPAGDTASTSTTAVLSGTRALAVVGADGSLRIAGETVPGISDAVGVAAAMGTPEAWVVRANGSIAVVTPETSAAAAAPAAPAAPEGSSEGHGGDAEAEEPPAPRGFSADVGPYAVVRTIEPESSSRRYKAVSVGRRHALLLAADGTVDAVGSDDAGQLGLMPAPLDRTEARSVVDVSTHRKLLEDGVPRNARTARVALPSGEKAAIVAAGGDHSVIVADSGSVFTFGSDTTMQLAHENIRSWDPAIVRAPLRVERRLTADGEKVVDAAAGDGFTILLTSDGVIHGAGRGDLGQLADGRVKHVSDLTVARAPSRIAAPVPAMRSVSCGDAHCAAVGKDGSVWVWGVGRDGQLGAGSRATQFHPMRVFRGDASMRPSVSASNAATVVSWDK